MMKSRNSPEKVIFNIIGVIFVSLFAIYCFIPFVLVISGSLTSEDIIIKHGYGLWPRQFSTEAYALILARPGSIIRAYGVTVLVTFSGTAAGLFLTSMTAYVLYRKDFKYRNKFAFFFYFTTLFNGGLVPFYILMVRYLHLKNNLLSLIIPGLLGVFNLLIMRNFINGSVPDSLPESAKIDGAGDFRIFISIVFPLLKPALATIGLFIALQYWNDWVQAMLYMENEKLYPLQYLLYRMIANITYLSRAVSEGGIDMPDLPQNSTKLAMTVVATGPIILLYPFVQKYFVQGITIGAVKG